MIKREIASGVWSIVVNDWNRRLFDSLIPLPDGTSYNAYLIRGREKSVLIDASDAAKVPEFLSALEGESPVDFVIGQHVEQDHAGAIPAVLERFPKAILLCTPKAKGMFEDHLHIPADRIRTVADGETIALGGRTLCFLHTPWVHWPETMCTWMEEDRILFTCDFFGSHLATTDAEASDECRVYEAAKRYYAEIMMPFRGQIRNHLDRLAGLPIGRIAPSHGPLYTRPGFILAAYRDWVSESCKNIAVVPYVSMHGSTDRMIARLVSRLAERQVTVYPFDLPVTDLGKLAESLVDAATVVFGVPTVLAGPHPAAAYAALLANALRPKIRYAGLVGSYSWATRIGDQMKGLLGNLKVEFLEPVLVRGCPRAEDLDSVARLADQIADRHAHL